jgi:hypothetical protein
MLVVLHENAHWHFLREMRQESGDAFLRAAVFAHVGEDENHAGAIASVTSQGAAAFAFGCLTALLPTTIREAQITGACGAGKLGASRNGNGDRNVAAP